VADDVTAALDRAYREERTALLATLTRQVGGDLGLAEDAVQDAFASAARDWVRRGVPDRPGAWLTVTARRRAIDRLRRDQTREAHQLALASMEALVHQDPEPLIVGAAQLHDDQLRLIFMCCHPALGLEARLALTLRSVGGLEVPELARAFLTSEAAIHKRLGRAKAKIVSAGISYRVPERAELPARVADVLVVLYLVYTEGHEATRGAELVRTDLSSEAIRLARLLQVLLPDDAEVAGLLALLLLTDARRPARTDPDGRAVALDEQDRRRWDGDAIAEGLAVLDRALGLGRPGRYQVQAAIAALHAEAPSFAETDWRQIVLLYAELERIDPSPVVSVNRAVALAQVAGPAAGLAALAPLVADDRLADYQPLHAARADLLAADGRTAEAGAAYRVARALSGNDLEREALRRRAGRLKADGGPGQPES